MDSPLKGLEQYEGAPVDQIRLAARGALVNLVDLAIEQNVAFVLIAGDLYDGNWKDYHTGLFFVGQAARLRAANIPLLLVSGNHDAANKMTRSLRLPENVRMFSTKAPESARIDGFDVAIHGQGFATAAVLDDLSLAYPVADSGCLNIGMLHTCGSGGGGGDGIHERYAPCTIEGLRSKQYDYWALGHVHHRQSLASDPLIEFPGNIQGRHARETGAKGCLLVTVNESRSITTEFRPLDVIRWETADVDLTEATVIDELWENVSQELKRLLQAAEGRSLAIRVELTGTTALHRELLAHRKQWTNEIRSIAIDIGGGELWIEKLKLKTADASLRSSGSAVPDGAIAELMSLFERLKSKPDELAALSFDLNDVARKLPGELESLVKPNDSEWIQMMLTESESVLFDRLLSRNSG